MDRVGNSSSPTPDYSNSSDPSQGPQCSETLATAPEPPAEAVASCPDGSYAFGEDGECARSGIKAPPTMSQTYIAHLTQTADGPAGQPTVGSEGERAGAHVDPGKQAQQVAADVTQELLHAIAARQLSGAVSYDFSHEVAGSEVALRMKGSVEPGVDGRLALNGGVSGSVHMGAAIGLAGDLSFDYSRDSQGTEKVKVQGCLLFQATANSSESPVGAGVEVGVCVSLEDSNRNTTQVQLEAVGKAGFRMGIGDWGIGHEFEVKVPLASERTDLDMIPQAASAAR